MYRHLLVWLGFLYAALICINLGLAVQLLTSKVNEIKEERLSTHPLGIYKTIEYRARNPKENYLALEGNNESLTRAVKDSINTNPSGLHVCVNSRSNGGSWDTLGVWPFTNADDRTKSTIKDICSRHAQPEQPTSNWFQEAINWWRKLWSNAWGAFARFLGRDPTEQENATDVVLVKHDKDGIPILEASYIGTVGSQQIKIRVFDTHRPGILDESIIETSEGDYNAQFFHYRDLVIVSFLTFLISTTILTVMLSWVICRRDKSSRKLLGRMSKRLKEATDRVLDDGALETRIGKAEFPDWIAYEVEEINKLLKVVEKKEQERRRKFETQSAGLNQVYSNIMLQAAIIPNYIAHDEGKGLRNIRELADGAVAEDWERKAMRIASTASELEHGLKEVRKQLIRLSRGDVSSMGEGIDVLTILEQQIEFARINARPGLIFDDTHVDTFSRTTQQFEFRRILQNIFDNAIKFGKSRIVISARVCDDEDRVEIVIENDGAALPFRQEEKDRLLEWGHRSGLHLNEEGNGIGLALAAMWLRGSGGEIKLTDPEMEGGARVTIWLAIG